MTLPRRAEPGCLNGRGTERGVATPVCRCMAQLEGPLGLRASLRQWWTLGLPTGALLVGAVSASLIGLGVIGSIVTGTLGLVAGAVLGGLISSRRAPSFAYTHGVS